MQCFGLRGQVLGSGAVVQELLRTLHCGLGPRHHFTEGSYLSDVGEIQRLRLFGTSQTLPLRSFRVRGVCMEVRVLAGHIHIHIYIYMYIQHPLNTIRFQPCAALKRFTHPRTGFCMVLPFPISKALSLGLQQSVEPYASGSLKPQTLHPKMATRSVSRKPNTGIREIPCGVLCVLGGGGLMSFHVEN